MAALPILIELHVIESFQPVICDVMNANSQPTRDDWQLAAFQLSLNRGRGMASFSGNGVAAQCRCRHPRIILSFLQPLWTSEPPGRKANMDRNHTFVNPNPNPANAQAHAQIRCVYVAL